MVDTLTVNVGFTDQTEGGNDNTWGVKTDENWQLADNLFGDTTSIVTTGGTTVLTDEQELVNAVEVSGTLVAPAVVEFSGRGLKWIVANDTTGAFSLTVKVTGETGIEIDQGATLLVWCDGDDIRSGHFEPVEDASEVTVASASTTNVLGAASEFVAISGTATITSFGTGASVKRFCRATGAFTITHNASSLICPGGSNILAVSGDTFIVISDASSNARIIMYQRAGVPPSYLPIGFVGDYAGSAAPSFWLLCFGQAISRTTYAALFAAISTTYGTGDGSTTFNLPDLRGRVVAGQDDMGGSSANRLTDQSGGLNGDTLGAAGGSETHTLTSAQMPTHSHSVTDPGHTHTYDRPATTENVGHDDIQHSVWDNVNGSTTTGSSTTGITLGNAGSGSAHNNVQPTFVLNKIIFAGV